MARQYSTPLGFINETGNRQYSVPGGFVNETQGDTGTTLTLAALQIEAYLIQLPILAGAQLTGFPLETRTYLVGPQASGSPAITLPVYQIIAQEVDSQPTGAVSLSLSFQVQVNEVATPVDTSTIIAMATMRTIVQKVAFLTTGGVQFSPNTLSTQSQLVSQVLTAGASLAVNSTQVRVHEVSSPVTAGSSVVLTAIHVQSWLVNTQIDTSILIQLPAFQVLTPLVRSLTIAGAAVSLSFPVETALLRTVAVAGAGINLAFPVESRLVRPQLAASVSIAVNPLWVMSSCVMPIITQDEDLSIDVSSFARGNRYYVQLKYRSNGAPVTGASVVIRLTSQNVIFAETQALLKEEPTTPGEYSAVYKYLAISDKSKFVLRMVAFANGQNTDKVLEF